MATSKEEKKGKEQNGSDKASAVSRILKKRDQTMGGGWGEWEKWGMGIKGSTCHEEHGVSYGNAESLNCIPDINITLYIN